MEAIPSLLNTSYAIAKTVSEFAKTGIYPLNLDVFSEEGFIPEKCPLIGYATM
jgi:hypothetical protein